MPTSGEDMPVVVSRNIGGAALCVCMYDVRECGVGTQCLCTPAEQSYCLRCGQGRRIQGLVVVGAIFILYCKYCVAPPIVWRRLWYVCLYTRVGNNGLLIYCVVMCMLGVNPYPSIIGK